MKGMKTLEINPRHPLIVELKRQVQFCHWMRSAVPTICVACSLIIGGSSNICRDASPFVMSSLARASRVRLVMYAC